MKHNITTKVNNFIMATKVTAIIERGSDGSYSIYTVESFEKFGLFGYGETPEKAKEDFWESYGELKEMMPDDVPEIDVNFKYDVASFLQEYRDEFSLSGLEVVTGVNQKQLQHYLSGHRKPSKTTIMKIQFGVREFAKKLANVEFA